MSLEDNIKEKVRSLLEILEQSNIPKILEYQQSSQIPNMDSEILFCLADDLFNEACKLSYDLKLPKYERCIDISANALMLTFNPKCFAQISLILQDIEDYDLSLRVLNAGIEKNPENAMLYLARGSLNEELGNYDNANSDYLNSIRCNNQSHFGYLGAARILVKTSKYKEAVEFLDSCLNNFEIPEFYALRGTCFKELGENMMALSDFSEAISLDPENQLYLEQRAELFFLSGDLDNMFFDLEEVLKNNPQNEGCLAMRARYHILNENYENSLQDYQSLIQLNPENPAFYKGKAEVLRILGKHEEASNQERIAEKLENEYFKELSRLQASMRN